MIDTTCKRCVWRRATFKNASNTRAIMKDMIKKNKNKTVTWESHGTFRTHKIPRPFQKESGQKSARGLSGFRESCPKETL